MTATSPETTETRLADIARELAQLASSGMPPGDFCRELLERSVEVTGAIAAAAWGLTPQGVLAQVAAIRFAEKRPAQSAAAARQHVQLLLEVLHSGQARVHPAAATSGPPHDRPAPNVLLLVPLMQRHNCVGVLEVILPPEAGGEEAEARLAALGQLSRCATQYLESQHLDSRAPARSQAPAEESPHQLISFIGQLHRDLQVGGVAMRAVNEGRRLMGCDRVILAATCGKTLKVLAISGQDRVREKSNLVRAITELASIVVAAGQPLHDADDVDDLPPQVREPLVTYLAESGATRFDALPLYQPSSGSDDDAALEPATAFGMLLLEWFSAIETDGPVAGQDATDQARAANLEAVSTHTAHALHNALLHEGAFLSPLLRALNRRLTAVERATRKRRATIAACGVLGLALLLFLPVPYYVKATGALAPVVHLGIFAPEDGRVEEVLAHGGERVDRGQLLLRLHNDAMATERLQAENRIAELEKALAALLAQRSAAAQGGARDASIRLEGRIAQTQIELDGNRARLADFKRELARLDVRSVVAGTVATFQPTQRLLHRPVRRGELLLEVLDETGPWQLELEIPAERVGHVLKARANQNQQRWPVRFTLATTPERTFEGVVHRLGTRVDATDRGAAVLSAQAAVNVQEIPVPTSGTEVFARIYCGRRSLAYWLFGDTVEFVRRRVW